MDETWNAVCDYNPLDVEAEDFQEDRQIQPNETLVGVYGVKGKEDWLTTLGFIVAKRNF